MSPASAQASGVLAARERELGRRRGERDVAAAEQPVAQRHELIRVVAGGGELVAHDALEIARRQPEDLPSGPSIRISAPSASRRLQQEVVAGCELERALVRQHGAHLLVERLPDAAAQHVVGGLAAVGPLGLVERRECPLRARWSAAAQPRG